MKDFSMEPCWDFLPPPPPGVNAPGFGWPGDEVHPVKNPPMLAPYSPPVPPAHTQVPPRCFTCKHFEMCQYKKDYLKTITLIQNDLGDPAFSYEMVDNYVTIPGFVGFPLMNEEDFFPKEIVFDNSDNKGKLFGAKFNGINFVNVVYKDTKYFILISLVYSNDSSLYELSKCQEAFYKVPYELNKDSLETIQLNLIEWRDMIINAKAPAELMQPRRPDIINTTHFSAVLDCDLYEWNKKSFSDSIKLLREKYPNGIPIDEHGRQLYHIATYRIIDGKVPYSPLYVGEQVNKPSQPFFPPPPLPPVKPSKRRGDL